MTTRKPITVLAAVLFVVGSMLGALLLAHATADDPRPEASHQPSRTMPGVEAAALGAKAGSAVGVGGARRSARQILAGWDVRRASAYADGDTRLLSSLYVPDSTAGAADVAVLQGYVAKGLHVEHLRMQVLSFRVVTRTPRRLVVDVTDRLVGAVAAGGDLRTKLPRDRADRRRITLVRREGAWLVSRVR